MPKLRLPFTVHPDHQTNSLIVFETGNLGQRSITITLNASVTSAPDMSQADSHDRIQLTKNIGDALSMIFPTSMAMPLAIEILPFLTLNL